MNNIGKDTVSTPRFFEEYHASMRLAAEFDQYCALANQFYTLIMAAMRFAGSEEMDALTAAFPDVATELRLRYNAPGGALNKQEFEIAKERATR